MTDMLHYQDVFHTNIPKTEHDIRLETTHLLGIARHLIAPSEDGDITSRFSRSIDTTGISQTFWEIKPSDNSAQRLLAITACGGGVVIGIDRRPTHDQPEAFRKSLHGFGYVFDSNHQSEAFHGSGSEKEVQQFFDEFYSTIAAIALHQRHIAGLETQNDSRSAIFANAV